MTLWRCAICGCDFDEAQAKRQAAQAGARRERRARRKLQVRESPRKRRRVIRPKGYRRRYRWLRVPRELAWRCRECGCMFKAAQAKRRRRGEREIRSLKTKTCSAERLSRQGHPALGTGAPRGGQGVRAPGLPQDALEALLRAARGGGTLPGPAAPEGWKAKFRQQQVARPGHEPLPGPSRRVAPWPSAKPP